MQGIWGTGKENGSYYMIIGYKAGFDMENGNSNGDYYIMIGFT